VNPTDHVYDARGGFIYTASRLDTQITVRPSAVVLISALDRPFELQVGGHCIQSTAALVRPQVCRRLKALDVGLISINVHPTHPAYPSFQSIDHSGVLPIAREQFARFNASLRAACGGALSAAEGARLFDRLIDATLPLLPCRLRAHPLRETLLTELARNPELMLADMALDFGVSYHRMSHLFNETLGLSFRAYANFELMRRASRHFFANKSSLTRIAHAAGFTDSAHLSNTWRKRYGLSPSYLRDNNCVQAIY
jgi:AraC family transcriptional regulator of arabinose operon